MKLIVAGIDPALRNFGLAKATYDTETGELTPIALKLIETDKDKGKQVRKNSDDLRRATEHCKAIHEWISDCNMVMVEIPVGSQSARACVSYGMCIGILSSIGVSEYKGRLIQVQPGEVKMAACDTKHASKDEMIEWATEKYPDLPWLKGRGGPGKKNEHLADAVAAIHAGIETDEFRNLIAALASF
tara:strand:+ start:1281 stop:1841 length:561 start_codon:yes stop_codon:yes gene_type:complete